MIATLKLQLRLAEQRISRCIYRARLRPQSSASGTFLTGASDPDPQFAGNGEASPTHYQTWGPGDHSDVGNNHDRGGLGDAYLRLGHQYLTQTLGLPLRPIPAAFRVVPQNMWVHDLSRLNGAPPPDHTPFVRRINPSHAPYGSRYNGIQY